MAADVTLQALATQATPLDYPIPAAVELVLKSLKASFDGTGAGGSWVPCVQLLVAGLEDATYPLGSTLPAGATADVSWFPGVKPPASTAAATTWPVAGASCTHQHVTSGATGLYFSLNASSFWTNDATTFAVQTQSAAGGGHGDAGIGILKVGTYLVTEQWSFFALAGSAITTPWTIPVTGSDNNGYSVLLGLIGPGDEITGTGTLPLGGGLAEWYVTSQTVYEVSTPIPATAPFVLQAIQESGETLDCYPNIFIQQLNAQTPF